MELEWLVQKWVKLITLLLPLHDWRKNVFVISVLRFTADAANEMLY